MTGQKMRYHPSVILENLAQVVAVLLLMLITTAQLRILEVFVIEAAVIGAVAFLLFLRWRKTTVQFNENEMVVERDTIFKMKKSIPYSKIASINVDRGIINRLFGTSRLKVNVNTSRNATSPRQHWSSRKGWLKGSERIYPGTSMKAIKPMKRSRPP